jgi:hypothetical protein
VTGIEAVGHGVAVGALVVAKSKVAGALVGAGVGVLAAAAEMGGEAYEVPTQRPAGEDPAYEDGMAKMISRRW